MSHLFKSIKYTSFTKSLQSFSSPFRHYSTDATNSMQRYKDKICLISGGTSGIGLSTAKRFLSEGGNVFISSRKELNVISALEELRKEYPNSKIDGMVSHVQKPSDRQEFINEAMRRFGKIDVLICNAAVNCAIGDILTTQESQWDKMMDVNIKSTFFLSKLAIDVMQRNEGVGGEGKGSVCFVSSASAYNPVSHLGLYIITKSALCTMTRVLGNECAKNGNGVRVNCVAPGFIETGFSELMWRKEDTIAPEVVASIPSKRIGKPEEVASSIAFLCSNDASYVQGETLVISGAWNGRN